MRLKDASVSLKDVSWRMFHAAVICEAVYAKRGVELVITSANDGKHGDKTLHHKGLALDLRTWTLGGRAPEVLPELKAALGDDYDVVLEKDHFHIEYDPS